MENITLVQIIKFVSILAGLITEIGIICAFVGKIYSSQMKKIINPLSDHIKEIDMEQCKNFLVRFLSDVEQKMPIDEVEKQRAHEVYERYTKLGGNSYIHNKWIKLMEER